MYVKVTEAMSFNSLKYDTCTYNQEQINNVSTLGYLLSTDPFDNCQKCRHEFGLVGGTSVSHVKGNIVDLESELRGQTRMNSKCPTRQYQGPSADGMITNERTAPLSTKATHLSSCQMIPYKPIALPPAVKVNRCSRP